VKVGRGFADVAQHSGTKDIFVFLFLGDAKAASVRVSRACGQPIVFGEAKFLEGGATQQRAAVAAYAAKRHELVHAFNLLRAQRLSVARYKTVKGSRRAQCFFVGLDGVGIVGCAEGFW
jgi:hypothetical protein